MAVDLLALFTKGIWINKNIAGRFEILAPIEVAVTKDVFEISVDFIYEDD
jgi:hypothetical protein